MLLTALPTSLATTTLTATLTAHSPRVQSSPKSWALREVMLLINMIPLVAPTAMTAA